MRPFRIIVRGVLDPKLTPEGPKERGFYTARAVMASSADAAGLEVIRLVASDPRIEQIMTEWGTGRPDISVDEVIELAPGEEADGAPLGFIFFSDDEADGPDPDVGYATEEELGL